MMYPRSRQQGANREMILIFPPAAVLSSDKWAMVGGESERGRKKLMVMVIISSKNNIHAYVI
jgi:hypothetical protein